MAFEPRQRQQACICPEKKKKILSGLIFFSDVKKKSTLFKIVLCHLFFHKIAFYFKNVIIFSLRKKNTNFFPGFFFSSMKKWKMCCNAHFDHRRLWTTTQILKNIICYLGNIIKQTGNIELNFSTKNKTKKVSQIFFFMSESKWKKSLAIEFYFVILRLTTRGCCEPLHRRRLKYIQIFNIFHFLGIFCETKLISFSLLGTKIVETFFFFPGKNIICFCTERKNNPEAVAAFCSTVVNTAENLSWSSAASCGQN